MKENTLVCCKTKAQVREVLAKAKKIGYRVHNDYVDRFWRDYRSETVINLNSNGQSVTYSDKDWYEKHYSEKIISAIEFLGFKPILITRKGRVVTAEDKNTGEKAIATCCPTDTFDLGTGAMIAVARLIAQSDKGITKDAETVLRQLLGYDAESPVDIPTEEEPKPFKKGDLVTLRPDVTPGIEYNGLTLRPGEMYDTAFRKPINVIRYDSDDQTYLCKAEGAEIMWWYDSDMLEAWDESKPEMPTTKFNVGDLVTLKDDLEVHKRYDGITLLENMYRNGHRKPIKVIGVDCNEHYDCAPFPSRDGSTVSYWYSEEMLEKWDENKIYEGDIVKVINTGLNYSTYPQWVGEHISDPDMAARYCFGSPSTDGNYKVIKIAEHESNGRTLAYIEQCDGFVFNKCYLVEIKGLEKVTEE